MDAIEAAVRIVVADIETFKNATKKPGETFKEVYKAILEATDVRM